MAKIVLMCLMALMACAAGQRITTIHLDGVQYFISRMNPYSPELNYFLAYQYCRSLGLQLASFETKEKAESMTLYLKNAGYGNYDFWTSGNRLGTGMFLWMSTGLPFNATFDFFENSVDAMQAGLLDPSDHNSNTAPQRTARDSSSGAEKGCVILKQPTLKWMPEDCSAVKDFICEQTRCYYYNYGSIPVSSAQGRPIVSTTTTTARPSINADTIISLIQSTTAHPPLLSTYPPYAKKLQQQPGSVSHSVTSSSSSSSASSSLSSSSPSVSATYNSLSLDQERALDSDLEAEIDDEHDLDNEDEDHLAFHDSDNDNESDNDSENDNDNDNDNYDEQHARELNDIKEHTLAIADEDQGDHSDQHDADEAHHDGEEDKSQQQQDVSNSNDDDDETEETVEHHQQDDEDDDEDIQNLQTDVNTLAVASSLLNAPSIPDEDHDLHSEVQHHDEQEPETPQILHAHDLIANDLKTVEVKTSSSSSVSSTPSASKPIPSKDQPQQQQPSVEVRLKQISQEIANNNNNNNNDEQHGGILSPLHPDNDDIGRQSFLSLSDLIRTLRPNDKQIIPQIDSDYSNAMRVLSEPAPTASLNSKF